MSLLLEFKKAKRTGFIPAFLSGGLLALIFPIVNMAVRSETFLSRQGSPIGILLNENWQMMSMINVLFTVVSACLLYHTEYADSAMQKMNTLPIREISIFFGKTVLVCILCIVVFLMEAASVAFCSVHWFDSGLEFLPELFKDFGYSFLMSLPCIVASLLLSSACKNMWTSLGIGVLCVFTATILPSDNFALSLFPFAMPSRLLGAVGNTGATHYIVAVITELIVITLAELLFIKIRRAFE